MSLKINVEILLFIRIPNNNIMHLLIRMVGVWREISKNRIRYENHYEEYQNNNFSNIRLLNVWHDQSLLGFQEISTIISV